MKRYALVFTSVVIALVALASVTVAMQRQAQAAPQLAVALPLLPGTSPMTPTTGVGRDPAWPAEALFAISAVTPVYTVSDSLSGGLVYEWVEVASAQTRLTPVDEDGDYDGDNGRAVVGDMGFYFPFYTNVYRQVRVSANGHVYFGDNDDNVSVVAAIPYTATPNNLSAAFGGDLYFHPAVSSMYFQHQTSPEERAVIEFVDAQWCCGLNDPHTFEIILYPDGRILAQYKQIRYLSNPHAWIVVGIENESGTDGLAYYEDWFDENDGLDDGMAVLFDPGDSVFGDVFLFPPARTEWDDRGYPLSFDADLVNMSGVTTTFDVSYALQISSSVAPTPTLWQVGVPTRTEVITCPGFANLGITAVIPLSAAWDDLAVLSVTVRSTVSSTVSRTMVITFGVAQRDLQVGKELGSMAPAPDGSFLYQLAFTNSTYLGSPRGAVARGVIVTDLLPVSVTLAGWFGPPPGYDYAGTVVTGDVGGRTLLTWTIDALDPGQRADLLVALDQTPPLSIGAQLVNTAHVTATLCDERGPFDNNHATTIFQVLAPSLNFELGKYFPGPNIIGPGQVATFTVYFYNEDNIYIDDVIITDTLPAGTLFYGTTWPTFTQAGDQIVFTIPRVPNGYWNERSFQIGVSVPVTIAIGTYLTNVVEITTTAPLTGFVRQAGDSDDEVIQVVDPNPDLWVTKYLPEVGGVPQIPEPGGDYRFWIQFGNSGISDVYTTTLVDTLPISYVTLLEASSVGVAQPITSTPGLVTWTIPYLAAGQSRWVDVLVRIDPDTPDGAQFVNRAEITSTTGISDRLPLNNVSIVTATLQGADVTVRKTATPTGGVRPGERLTYTLQFSNVGELPATGVYLRDGLPAGLVDVLSSTSGVSLQFIPGSPLRWYVPDGLEPGVSGMLTLSARVDDTVNWPAGSVLTNVAAISSVTGEPPGHAANTSIVVNFVETADPYVDKTGPTMALPGELLTYTLEYGNLGNLAAGGVWLTDTLPVSTTYMTDTSGLPVVQNGNQVSWYVGNVPTATTGLTFALVLNLDAAVPVGTALINRLDISSTSFDGDHTNNQAWWRTAVGYDLTPSYKLADGTAGKWVDPGARLTFTIVLSNIGPFSATNVLVQDVLPAFTTFVSGSLSSTVGVGGFSSGVVTWTGTVAGFASVQVTLQVTVAEGVALPRGYEIVNTAAISDGVNDLEASVVITLTGPVLDVPATSKTVDQPEPLTGEVITFTIVVQNEGELAAQALVTDLLPFAYVAYTGRGQASSGLLDDSGAPTILWTGVVTPAERISITLPVTVTAPSGIGFDNVAHIADGTGNVFTRAVRVNVSAPDLDNSLTQKTANVSSIGSGSRLTYTLALFNNGDGDAPAVRVTDTLPAGVVYAGGAFASSGVLDDSGAPTLVWTGYVTSTPGGISPPVWMFIPVTVTAAPGSVVVNQATIDDGVGTIFVRQASVHVWTQPALTASDKDVWPAVAAPGETLYYTLTVRNSGETGTSFVVTDTLDPDTLYQSGSANWPVSYADGQFVWAGTVGPLTSTMLTFRAALSPTTRLAVTNTAWFDDMAGSVYSDTAVTQLAHPLLDAVKRVEPAGLVLPNQRLTYTLVLSNAGNAPMQFTLVDPIPDYADYGYWFSVDPINFPTLPTFHPLSDTLTFNGVLLPGNWVTLRFAVNVQADALGQVIINTATLDGLDDDAPAFTRSVEVMVGERIFLPLVLRQ